MDYRGGRIQCGNSGVGLWLRWKLRSRYARGGIERIRVGECDPQGLWAQIVYVDLVGVEEAAAEVLVTQAAKQAVTKARSKPLQKPNFPQTADTEMAAIQTHLQQHQTVSIVSLRSMGGVGKTELALQCVAVEKCGALSGRRVLD